MQTKEKRDIKEASPTQTKEISRATSMSKTSCWQTDRADRAGPGILIQVALYLFMG